MFFWLTDRWFKLIMLVKMPGCSEYIYILYIFYILCYFLSSFLSPWQLFTRVFSDAYYMAVRIFHLNNIPRYTLWYICPDLFLQSYINILFVYKYICDHTYRKLCRLVANLILVCGKLFSVHTRTQHPFNWYILLYIGNIRAI